MRKRFASTAPAILCPSPEQRSQPPYAQRSLILGCLLGGKSWVGPPGTRRRPRSDSERHAPGSVRARTRKSSLGWESIPFPGTSSNKAVSGPSSFKPPELLEVADYPSQAACFSSSGPKNNGREENHKQTLLRQLVCY